MIRAIVVLVLVGAGIALTHSQRDAQTLTPTPVQQYNEVCLVNATSGCYLQP